MRIPMITIGTANFGMNYGISNDRGGMLISEIEKIFYVLRERGIKNIDTARTYGRSEEVLGDIIQGDDSWLVTTKLEPLGNSNNLDTWKRSIDQSLRSLDMRTIECIMVHDLKDFESSINDKLVDFLSKLKNTGVCNKLGLSIYSNDYVNQDLLDVFDKVQVPYSAFDRRIVINGILDRFIQSNVKVECRSIFLQGLILLDSKDLPLSILPRDRDSHHLAGKIWKNNGFSRLSGSLHHVTCNDWVDSITFGVASANELIQVLDCFSARGDYDSQTLEDIEGLAFSEQFIDPRQWNR